MTQVESSHVQIPAPRGRRDDITAAMQTAAAQLLKAWRSTADAQLRKIPELANWQLSQSDQTVYRDVPGQAPAQVHDALYPHSEQFDIAAVDTGDLNRPPISRIFAPFADPAEDVSRLGRAEKLLAERLPPPSNPPTQQPKSPLRDLVARTRAILRRR